MVQNNVLENIISNNILSMNLCIMINMTRIRFRGNYMNTSCWSTIKIYQHKNT